MSLIPDLSAPISVDAGKDEEANVGARAQPSVSATSLVLHAQAGPEVIACVDAKGKTLLSTASKGCKPGEVQVALSGGGGGPTDGFLVLDSTGATIGPLVGQDKVSYDDPGTGLRFLLQVSPEGFSSVTNPSFKTFLSWESTDCGAGGDPGYMTTSPAFFANGPTANGKLYYPGDPEVRTMQSGSSVLATGGPPIFCFANVFTALSGLPTVLDLDALPFVPEFVLTP